MPSPNGYQAYLIAQAALVNFTPPVDPYIDALRKPPDSAHALPRRLAWLAANQKALALVDKAVPLPFFRPATLPLLGRPLRPLAQALVAASHTEQLAGLWGPSVHHGLELLSLAFKQEHGADTLGVLSLGPERDPAFLLLQQAPAHLSAAEAKAAARTAESLEGHRETFANVLERERIERLLELAGLTRVPDWRRGVAESSGIKPEWMARLRLELVPLNHILREVSAVYATAIANSKKSYESFATPAASQTRFEVWHLAFVPPILNFYYRLDTCRLRLLTLRFALRAYLVEHGHYPQQLQELVPHYLTTVPNDPFGPGPMHYRSQSGVYTCWSVGPDGVDNHGQPIRSKPRRRVQPNDTGDVVVGPTAPTVANLH